MKSVKEPGKVLFEAATKYAAADRDAWAACEAGSGDDAKKAACHEKARQKSKEKRKKLRKKIKEQHSRLIKLVKRMDDLSEGERGRAMIRAGRYIAEWDELATTGKGEMLDTFGATSDVVVIKRAKVRWPLYPKGK